MKLKDSSGRGFSWNLLNLRSSKEQTMKNGRIIPLNPIMPVSKPSLRSRPYVGSACSWQQPVSQSWYQRDVGWNLGIQGALTGISMTNQLHSQRHDSSLLLPLWIHRHYSCLGQRQCASGLREWGSSINIMFKNVFEPDFLPPASPPTSCQDPLAAKI